MVLGSLYRFPADMSVLPATLDLVDRLSVNFDTAAVMRAQTALEELFSNTVHHGVLPSGAQAGVGIAVEVRDGVLYVHIEDECEPFDPFAALDVVWAETDLPVEDRRVGGLGCLMVHGLSDDARYTRAGQRNCVDLRFCPRPTRSPRDGPGDRP
jgi:serine/threonine-protein kinase RsbW